MATLRIAFTPASPAPTNGYLIAYKRVGTSDPLTTVTVSASPADITVTDGWSYEGTIRSDCGSGVFSPTVAFTANILSDPCYLYEFSNSGTTVATVYYKLCNTNDVLSFTVTPIGSGGTQVYQCMRSDYVIINSTQAAPGSTSGTIDNVAYARATDPTCV